ARGRYNHGVIDSHTHLDSLADYVAALTAARAVGVQGMVSIGCGSESIRATLDIARANMGDVRVTAGVHPLAASTFDLSAFDDIAALARDPLVVAIGETGFDQFHDAGTLEQQHPAFSLQAELARELALPLIIHTRDAEEHTLAALEKEAGDLDVVLHCFSLTQPEHLARVLEHDRWVCSFAGNVTYGSAQALRDACAQIPLDRLMVETDAPYLAPKPMRGKRNEPAFVQHTLQVLADVHGITFDAARSATVATAERTFGWTPAAIAGAV
ncbi:MAG: LuxR family transcriptional regulator, partial [Thermoleophilia bacterium]|nr:LuxR family transcriptional regulator [Thermoleophilia bacterium]